MTNKLKVAGTICTAFVAANIAWAGVKDNVCQGIDSLDSPDGFSIQPPQSAIFDEGAKVVFDRPEPLTTRVVSAASGFYMCPKG